jgi:phage-related protein
MAHSVAASDTAIEMEGLAEVVSLIDGIVFTVLSSVVGLAVAIPPVIGRIAADALGLIRQHIETIITIVTSLVR